MSSPENSVPTDTRLMEAIFRSEGMASDISEMKHAMREMARAMTTLAVVEERQAQDRLEIGRVFGLLESHDVRLKALEIAQPANNQTSGLVNKGMWLVFSAIIAAIMGMVIVTPKDAYHPTSTRTTTEVQK